MKIIFTNISSTSYSFIDHDDNEIDNELPSNCSLYLFGKSIITRNISILNSIYNIESIVIPKKMNFLKSIIQSEFKDIPISNSGELEEKKIGKINRDYNNNNNDRNSCKNALSSINHRNVLNNNNNNNKDNNDNNNDGNISSGRQHIDKSNILVSSSITPAALSTRVNSGVIFLSDSSLPSLSLPNSKSASLTPINPIHANTNNKNETIFSTNAGSHYAQSVLIHKNETIIMPCNTIIGNNSTKTRLEYFRFQYPWEFLDIIQELLSSEIRTTMISSKATIAKTAIIEGPCIIEDNVVIDDFAKIKGPVYIGKGSFIGMGSLIRNSMLDYNTHIGFNCEIGKSYFAGNAKISHHNVILDSIIGKNVWFGGYSGTANVLLTRQNIQYKINGKLTDTGKNHFGAVVSNNCSVGASVIILPGRKLSPNSIIPAGTILSK